MNDGRVSETALHIARLLVAFGDWPGLGELLPAGLAADVAAVLTGAGLLGRRHRAFLGAPGFRPTTAAVAAALGGVLPHFVLRKRFVDDAVADAIADGAEQLLVIGAGFDPLAARWARRHPSLGAVELDHPATGLAKARGARAAGLHAPNLRLVPVDLSVHPLPQALARAGWRAAPSVVVAEGLLMYLPPAAVDQLLADVFRLTAPGSRLVFTWLPRTAGRLHFHPALRAAIRLRGEPTRFAIEAHAQPRWAADRGWSVTPPVDLRERYLRGGRFADAALADMERFSVATRA